MQAKHLVFGALALGIFAVASQLTPHPSDPKAYISVSSLMDSIPGDHPKCISTNGLPDPNCTKGAINPNCTLTDVKTSGYSATVRPSTSITNPEKLKVMSLYGMDGQNLATIEGDHLLPISLCGCPGPNRQCDFDQNFWPEKWTLITNGMDYGAHAKDAVEYRMLKYVRSGKITLSKAQNCIVTNWRTCPK